MAPGGVGNVYALDLRFQGKALLADLDEVHPTAGAAEELDPYLRWDTGSTSADACSLLQGVADVELPFGYAKHPTRRGTPISASCGGYFWDHVLEKNGSGVILILPEGCTFSSDHSPPIRCNATGHIRLSAKEFKGRIAILFTIEPNPRARNLRTTWHMARLEGSVSAEVQRINSLPAQPPPAPPNPPALPKPPFYKRPIFWLGAGIVCLLAVWQGYEHWVACGKFIDPPIVHHAGRDIAHYVRDGNADRVIVFIHGIFGDAEGTWTSPPDVYWPDLIVSDDQFGKPDIYVAKYDTGVGNSMNMDEVAEGLYQRFNDAGVFSRHRQVILVCHSLGGLVAQRFLLKHRNLAQQVPLIYFYGTPQTGAQVARVGSVFNDDPLLREMAPGASNDYLTTMESDWHNAGFSTVHRLCAYEKLKYKCVLIVDNLSGTRGCENAVALNKNHVNIVKPANTQDASYILLRNAWREIPNVPPQANNSVSPSISMSLALITTIYRLRDSQTHDYMKGGQNDLVGVLRVQQRNGLTQRHVRSLQVVGNAAADFNSYMGSFSKGDGTESVDDLEADYARRRPFYRLSWVSYPSVPVRIDPNDEEFGIFNISQSGGAISTLIPRNGSSKDYFGFESTDQQPKYSLTTPAWHLLVRFSTVNPADSTGLYPVLRDEVKSGKVKLRVDLDGEVFNIPVQDIRFPWAVPITVFFSDRGPLDKTNLQDLFYGVDRGERTSLPKRKDPLIQ